MSDLEVRSDNETTIEEWREIALHECKSHKIVLDSEQDLSGEQYDFMDIQPDIKAIPRRSSEAHIDRSEEFMETWWVNGWNHPRAFSRMFAGFVHSILGLALSNRENAKALRLLAETNRELAIELRVARLERHGEPG